MRLATAASAMQENNCLTLWHRLVFQHCDQRQRVGPGQEILQRCVIAQLHQ
jgi:hypothetical protein